MNLFLISIFLNGYLKPKKKNYFIRFIHLFLFFF